jgi:hypothetical protein
VILTAMRDAVSKKTHRFAVLESLRLGLSNEQAEYSQYNKNRSFHLSYYPSLFGSVCYVLRLPDHLFGVIVFVGDVNSASQCFQSVGLAANRGDADGGG